MMTLDALNLRLAPLGKKLYRVTRHSLVRYALGPDFMITWPTYGDALEDLSTLTFLHDTPYSKVLARQRPPSAGTAQQE